MNKESIFYKTISEILLIDITNVPLEKNVFEIEGWDSLAHIRIITELEDNFEKKLTDNEMIEISSLGALKVAFLGK